MTDEKTSYWVHYVVGAILALAILGLIAWARGQPGDDDRTPGHASGPVVVGTAA